MTKSSKSQGSLDLETGAFTENKAPLIKYQFTGENFAEIDPNQLDESPSETIPDSSLSIPEILSRFSKGLPLSAARQPVYYGDDDIPDFRRMDLADIQEYKEQNKQKIKDLEQDLEAAILAEKQKQQKQEEIKNPPTETKPLA